MVTRPDEAGIGYEDDMGECDVAGCTRPAVTAIVGEAGDFWLCRAHYTEGAA